MTITTGLVDTYSTPTLLGLLQPASGRRPSSPPTTSPLTSSIDAYDTFSRAGETGALKVVVSRTR